MEKDTAKYVERIIKSITRLMRRYCEIIQREHYKKKKKD